MFARRVGKWQEARREEIASNQGGYGVLYFCLIGMGIVGAIVGFASVGISVDAVNWIKVGNIAASWVVSPVLAGTVAFFLYMSVRRFVFDTADPFASAKRVIPFYIFMVGFVISMVTMVKGLTDLNQR